MLEQLTYSLFTQYLQQKFIFCLEPEREIELELIEAVDQSKVKNSPEGYEAFSIVFQGPKQPFLQQATYPVRHSEIGEFSLFIVPIRQDREGFYYYEAVFSRLNR
ncbi:DUF6916 family protein [Nostoc sp. FACHB-145]|uniref:DUF6916 family protein n=1 Tax=Nostoc sp. FACHB-145 TaxID=2692836 RepID=UPI00168377A2|nr:hypothetical protein [Nostoc sp. FACHB-145]MBD2472962.1 hypothetical protein [Nostoc sp. FACHB-145]